jgi:uncharacterized membrane protein YcaP (DUF421 family)
MDFIHGQETLTALEWVFRAVFAYIFLVIVAKALGQRAISQLRLLDFVIALVIGNIIAHPLSDEELGLLGSMISTIVLVVLYVGSILIILKFPSLRRIINPSPIILVQNGEILYKGLRKARISIDVLLEELREKKADDVKKVTMAIWEADGKISVFLHPAYEPATPSNLQLSVEPFELPRIIVKEGIINYDELKKINKDANWVISNLKRSYSAEVKDVLLATFDNSCNLKVFLYR